MAQGFDQQSGRYFYRAGSISRGINLSAPKREVPDMAGTAGSNILFRLGQIVPGYQAATEKWTPAEDITYMFLLRASPELLILMGKTKAWAYPISTALDEITPTTPFANLAQNWRGETIMHLGAPVAVVTNFGNDVPHMYTGVAATNFIPVTNAPVVRTFCGSGGSMLCGGIYDGGASKWYENRVEWSGAGDITDWSSLSWGYLDLFGEYDPIYRLEETRDGYVLIFRRRSIYVGLWSNSVLNPFSARSLDEHGIIAPNGLQKAGDTFFFPSDDDIYKFTLAGGVVSIGSGIRDAFRTLRDDSKTMQIWSFLNPFDKEYYLVTPQLDGTTRAWIYNYEQDAWSYQDFSTYLALGVWYAA